MGRQHGSTLASEARVSAGADDFLLRLQEERQVEIEKDRAEKRKAREKREQLELKHRRRQAELAKQSPGVQRLVKGSVARRVAMGIIQNFPTATPIREKGEDLNRTEVARRKTLQSLKGEDILDNDAIAHGTMCARSALRAAFDQLEKQKRSSRNSEQSSSDKEVTEPHDDSTEESDEGSTESEG